MPMDTFFKSLIGTVKPGEALATCSDNFVMRPWVPGKVPPDHAYFCISTVKWANARDRRVYRDAGALVRTFVIVLDDIGTKIPIERIKVEPTYKLNTSPGNWQYGYKITGGMAPAEAAALIAALIEAGYSDKGATGANHVFRFPGSSNNKPGLEEPFESVLTDSHPEREWTRAELWVAFNVLPGGLQPALSKVNPLAPGEVDPVHKWCADHREISGYTGKRSSTGFYEILCPGHITALAEGRPGHTPTNKPDWDKAGWAEGSPGAFYCFHDHCQDWNKDNKKFKAWIKTHDPAADLEPRMPDLAGLGADIAAARRGEETAPPLEPEEEVERVLFERDRVRRLVVNDLIHVATERKYWSIKANDFFEYGAIDHDLYAIMRPTDLLAGTTPTGRDTIWQPQVWLKNQRDVLRATKVTHRLGQPLIIDNCLNIAPPIPPRLVVEGDPEPWLDLVDFVCGSDEAADQKLDWMAMVVTAWDEKPGWHVLLKGPPGVGKDLMLMPLVTYMAPKHWYGITVKNIGSEFTPFLARRLIILDELKMTTHGQLTTHDIYNNVKAWTARGTGWVMINEKNLKPYEALDLSCWGLTSNAEVPLPLEEGDRRWDVTETPRKPRSKVYYNAIVKWLYEEGGWRIVITWLQRRWDAMSEARREVVRGTAPVSVAKSELIINSAEGIDGAVRLAILGRFGEPWPDLMTVNEAQSKLGSSDLMSEQARRSLTSKRVAMALKGAGAVQLFGGKSVENSADRRTMRLWCLRADKAEGYEALKGKAIFEEYDRQRGGGGGIVSGSNVFRLR